MRQKLLEEGKTMQKQIKTERQIGFDILKCLAILLVLNSHLDIVYPPYLKKFAFGGMWGNILFFSISGYFVRRRKGTIWSYMNKKVQRLYPSTWIVMLVLLILGLDHFSDWKEALLSFAFLSKYWFVTALMIYYLIFGLLEEQIHRFSTKSFLIFTLVHWTILVLFYVVFVDKNSFCMEQMGFDTTEGWLKIIYFFYIFMLAYEMKIDQLKKPNLVMAFFLAIVGGVGYMILKIHMQNGNIPMLYQIFLPFFAYIMSYGSIGFAEAFQKRYMKRQRSNTLIFNGIKKLSELSLEIYLVQFAVISFWADRLLFPYNFAVIIVTTFAVAWCVRCLANKLMDYCGDISAWCSQI